MVYYGIPHHEGGWDGLMANEHHSLVVDVRSMSAGKQNQVAAVLENTTANAEVDICNGRIYIDGDMTDMEFECLKDEIANFELDFREA